MALPARTLLRQGAEPAATPWFPFAIDQVCRKAIGRLNDRRSPQFFPPLRSEKNRLPRRPFGRAYRASLTRPIVSDRRAVSKHT